MTEMISGIVGEFPGSLAEGPEKTKPEEAFMKISLGVSCTLQSRGKQISAIEIYERLLSFLYSTIESKTVFKFKEEFSLFVLH